MYELRCERVHGHGLEFCAISEQRHELAGFFRAVVSKECALGFLMQDGNAFGATPPMTDGVFHGDLCGAGPIAEENLHGVRDRTLLGIEVITRIQKPAGRDTGGT